MRKILAITLALSLAMSGAAFATDYTLTDDGGAIDENWGPTGDMTNADGDGWLNPSSVKFVSDPAYLYPGDKNHTGDKVTLTTAADAITLTLLADSDVTATEKAGPVTLAELATDSTNATVTLNVNNALTVNGKLEDLTTAANNTTFVIDPDNGSIYADSVVMKPTGAKSMTVKSSATTTNALFQIGGVEFTPKTGNGTKINAKVNTEDAANALTFATANNRPVDNNVTLVSGAKLMTGETAATLPYVAWTRAASKPVKTKVYVNPADATAPYNLVFPAGTAAMADFMLNDVLRPGQHSTLALSDGYPQAFISGTKAVEHVVELTDGTTLTMGGYQILTGTIIAETGGATGYCTLALDTVNKATEFAIGNANTARSSVTFNDNVTVNEGGYFSTINASYSDAIKLHNVVLPEDSKVMGILELGSVYASDNPADDDSDIDLTYPGYLYGAKSDSGAKVTFGKKYANVTLNAAADPNQGSIVDNTKADGGLTFTNAIVTAVKSVEGYVKVADDTVFCADNEGISIANGTLEIESNSKPYGLRAAADTENPEIFVENKGVLAIADELKLTAAAEMDKTPSYLTVKDGGTLCYTDEDADVTMTRTVFENNSTLKIDATPLPAPTKFKISKGFNDAFEGNFTIDVGENSIATFAETSIDVKADSTLTLKGDGNIYGNATGTNVVINVPEGSTLVAGHQPKVIDINLEGNLKLSGEMLDITRPIGITGTNDGNLVVGNNAKIDIIDWCKARLEGQDYVSKVENIAEIFSNDSPLSDVIYAKCKQGQDAADILSNNSDIHVLFRVHEVNKLGLVSNSDKIWQIPAVLVYDEARLTAGTFTVSPDLSGTEADIIARISEYAPDTPDTPTTGTIPAPTPVKDANEVVDGNYAYDYAADALAWQLDVAQETTAGEAVTLKAGTAKAYVDGTEVECDNGKVSGNTMTVTLAADSLKTDDEFALTFKFNDETITTTPVKVSVGKGKLNITADNDGTYDVADGNAKFTLSFTNKFVTVTPTMIGWTASTGDEGNTENVEINISGLADGTTVAVAVDAMLNDLPGSNDGISFTVKNEKKSSGSGGGCSAGVASLALLLAIPMLLKKR